MATATASKTKLKIFPLADRVVIRPLEETETMKGGLYIPDTAKEKPIQGEVIAVGPGRREKDARSEEHTSELQSPCNLVCRLLLEKKKKKIIVGHLGLPEHPDQHKHVH